MFAISRAVKLLPVAVPDELLFVRNLNGNTRKNFTNCEFACSSMRLLQTGWTKNIHNNNIYHILIGTI